MLVLDVVVVGVELGVVDDVVPVVPGALVVDVTVVVAEEGEVVVVAGVVAVVPAAPVVDVVLVCEVVDEVVPCAELPAPAAADDVASPLALIWASISCWTLATCPATAAGVPAAPSWGSAPS